MDKKKRLIDLSVGEFESLLLDFLSDNSNSNSDFNSEIMDVEICARFLNKSPVTIYKYMSQKKIPFVKKNGSVYFLKSEILEWIKNE